MQTLQAKTITIVYDKYCPICQHFTKGIRLRRLNEQLNIVNARDSQHPDVKRLKQLNINLNDTMAVIYDQEIYTGAQAMTWLSMMTSPSHTLNRLIFFFFRYPKIGQQLYPILKTGRLLLLKILKRPQI